MKKKKISPKPYLYALPSMLIIAVVVVFPILFTGYISFTNMNVYHWFDYSFAGFKNYQRALLVADSGFFRSLIITVLWTFFNLILQLIIAFALALLLNTEHLRFRNFYKTVLMFPWAMPGYVSILLWKTGMFNSKFGLLNQWLRKWDWSRCDGSVMILRHFCPALRLTCGLPCRL
jgi:arabinogalactan oligomer/maltooligosaccharide transport system permease protein